MSFTADYAAYLSSGCVVPPWRAQQSVDGRITMHARSPGDGGPAMRVELQPGDQTNTGGYVANRSEVYGCYPETPATSTPWDEWPLAGEHTFRWRMYLEPGWVFDNSKWLILTQFKGFRGGSPPLAIAVDGGRFKLVGKRNVFLAPATTGVWHDITVRARFAVDGGVEVSMDGTLFLPWWSGTTVDVVNGQTDPVYLKQGIYRTSAWTVPHVAWFGPVVVS